GGEHRAPRIRRKMDAKTHDRYLATSKQRRVPGTAMAEYRVTALNAGEFEIPGPELFWMGAWGEWYRLNLIVLLVQGDGVTALVNTGPPDDIGPLNDLFVQAVGERGRLNVGPEHSVVAQLTRLGVSPEAVTHLLVTPFQAYASGGIGRFPGAQVCLSKRGWLSYHTTHTHPHDGRDLMFTKSIVTALVTDRWDQVRLLEDEDEILPGLRTWFAGTHHRASVAVEIDTRLGTVVASDAFFHYANIEQNRLLGINESMYEGLSTYERARRSADIIVPLYEPRVFERHPGGELA
ncbi:MAG: hypothetical protein ACRDZT_02115, partial [Acidimicrobiales bacterium]